MRTFEGEDRQIHGVGHEMSAMGVAESSKTEYASVVNGSLRSFSGVAISVSFSVGLPVRMTMPSAHRRHSSSRAVPPRTKPRSRRLKRAQ